MSSNTHFSMAVHVMTALAYKRGEVLPSEDLAASIGTNASFLRQLIGRLRDAGLVRTRLGKGGGVVFEGDPRAITLADIYAAVEQRPALCTHTCDSSAACEVSRAMPEVLAEVGARVDAAIRKELGRTRLSDLVKRYVV
jgi:Rrf2 family protein